MVVKEFGIKEPSTRITVDGVDWVEAWYGYYRMKSISQVEITDDLRKREIDSFLTILGEINKTEVSLLELGAGWGEWGLALAGVINFGIVPTKVKQFNYLAVEGEPYYCEIIKKHFDFNLVHGKILNAAVSNKNGSCYFDKFKGDRFFFDTWCTQGMTFRGNVAGSKLKTFIMAMYRVLSGEVIKVPMYTPTKICEMYNFYPDIVHMDIFGVEEEIVREMKYKPSYYLIGTHSQKINRDIGMILKDDYEIILDILPTKQKTNGLSQDGVLLLKKK